MERKMWIPRSAVITYLACSLVLLLAGCSSPTSSSGSGGSSALTNVVPVVGFTNLSSVSKAVIPAGTAQADGSFSLFAPMVTQFVSASTTYSNGASMPAQTFFGTTVTFTVSTFTNGTNGVSSGNRYSGSISDGSGSVLIEYNPTSGSIYYEEWLFISDPNAVFSSNPANSVVHIAMSGTLSQSLQLLLSGKNSFIQIGTTTTGAMLGYTPKQEVYSGNWNTGSSAVTGVGAVLLRPAFANLTSTTLPSISGVTAPTSLSVANLTSTENYLKAWEANEVSGSPLYSSTWQPYVIFRRSTDTTATVYSSSPWNGVAITSAALAAQNLPSAVWQGVTSVASF